jgi:hypothetical protein
MTRATTEACRGRGMYVVRICCRQLTHASDPDPIMPGYRVGRRRLPSQLSPRRCVRPRAAPRRAAPCRAFKNEETRGWSDRRFRLRPALTVPDSIRSSISDHRQDAYITHARHRELAGSRHHHRGGGGLPMLSTNGHSPASAPRSCHNFRDVRRLTLTGTRAPRSFPDTAPQHRATREDGGGGIKKRHPAARPFFVRGQDGGYPSSSTMARRSANVPRGCSSSNVSSSM